MTTDNLLRNLEELQSRAMKELENASSTEALERWRVAYLGRRGELTQVLRGLGSLATEERRTVGAIANRVKAALEEGLAAAEQAAKEAELKAIAETGRLDVTLPGRPVTLGRLHPTTQMVREICNVFVSMGFQVMEGPEVEWD
ncbi:MAG: phenylalanine--tRNA ligase subunit alpha, partial [Chloroflexi bacterium]|nr:phenylalanine--tRNA ligase subunit alpha [Chloroflexota bacterium]